MMMCIAFGYSSAQVKKLIFAVPATLCVFITRINGEIRTYSI